jgi:hypothetical protein
MGGRRNLIDRIEAFPYSLFGAIELASALLKLILKNPRRKPPLPYQWGDSFDQLKSDVVEIFDRTRTFSSVRFLPVDKRHFPDHHDRCVLTKEGGWLFSNSISRNATMKLVPLETRSLEVDWASIREWEPKARDHPKCWAVAK